jgi:DNA-binding XRE family transcriptional regulator
MLLIGGDKTGRPRWYEEFVPRADDIYARHLREIENEQERIMARKFEELRAQMSPERRARNAARASEELAKMPLYQLRNAREMTQTRLAEILNVQQASISKLENRTDMYLSTLRSYVEAMGGTLEVRAVFPEGEVKIEMLKKISA